MTAMDALRAPLPLRLFMAAFCHKKCAPMLLAPLITKTTFLLLMRRMLLRQVW